MFVVHWKPMASQSNLLTWTENTHTQPFNGLWSGTTRVGRYQKKHSPTHTHPDHRTSFIIFLHLQRSMASSLFSLRAWQSSRTKNRKDIIRKELKAKPKKKRCMCVKCAGLLAKDTLDEPSGHVHREISWWTVVGQHQCWTAMQGLQSTYQSTMLPSGPRPMADTALAPLGIPQSPGNQSIAGRPIVPTQLGFPPRLQTRVILWQSREIQHSDRHFRQTTSQPGMGRLHVRTFGVTVAVAAALPAL